jgi:hypothetical protein
MNKNSADEFLIALVYPSDNDVVSLTILKIFFKFSIYRDEASILG